MARIVNNQNRKHRRLTLIAFSASFYLGLFTQGMAQQAFPWQQSSPPQQQAQQPQAHHHSHHAKKGKKAHSSHRTHGNARVKDDRKLDDLATSYYQISPKDEKAVEKLKALEGRVGSYRASLKKRDYDTSDIARDAKKLEGRIAARRKKLEEPGTATASPEPDTKK